MTPSFLKSTLSMMTVIALLTIVYCIIAGVKIEGELLAVLTGIIGAYTGSRLPNSKPDDLSPKSINE